MTLWGCVLLSLLMILHFLHIYFSGGKLDDQTIYQNHHERNQSAEKSLMNIFKYSIIFILGPRKCAELLRSRLTWSRGSSSTWWGPTTTIATTSGTCGTPVMGDTWTTMKCSKMDLFRGRLVLLIGCREQQSKYEAWLVMMGHRAVALIPLRVGNGWSNVL